MMIIAGLGSVGSVGMARKPPGRAAGPGFRVAEGGAGAEPVLAPSAAVGTGLLALQQAGEEEPRDREARRHGQALLAALSAVQRALLGAEQGLAGERGPALERVSSLLRAMPAAADPQLAAVQKAMRVRVAVELARARAAASE